MLYWIKTEAIRMQASALWAIATRQDLSQRLGRDESTVYRWLKRYKQGGIEALLEVKTAPGKQALIPTTVMSQLHQRDRSSSRIQELQPNPRVVKSRMPSCSSVQNSTQNCTKHALNAKLKVPRPHSAKAKPEVQEAFKKNFQT